MAGKKKEKQKEGEKEEEWGSNENDTENGKWKMWERGNGQQAAYTQ